MNLDYTFRVPVFRLLQLPCSLWHTLHVTSVLHSVPCFCVLAFTVIPRGEPGNEARVTVYLVLLFPVKGLDTILTLQSVTLLSEMWNWDLRLYQEGN